MYTLNLVVEDLPGIVNKNFFNHFPQTFFKYVTGTVEDFSTHNQPYIYCIFVVNDPFFENTKPFKIKEKVSLDCFSGLAKVLVYFPLEGYINDNTTEWLNKFGRLNDLNTRSLIFAHCSLNLQEHNLKNNIQQNFSYYPINYFEFNPWYTSPVPSGTQKYQFLIKLNSLIQQNRNKKINKHFNILMRVRRTHRMLLFSEIKTNHILNDKADVSLGLDPHTKIEDYFYEFNKLSAHNSFFKKNLEYLKSFDFSKSFTLDENLEENLAHTMNSKFYSDYFCSITSETHAQEKTIFFSEKTFKPILNLQPFIIFGTQHSLKYLQQIGYRTFSDWWDESYDEEENYSDRLIKIVGVMEQIASWSDDKLFRVTQEMEQILIHNYLNFVYNRRYEYFIKELAFNNQEKIGGYSRLI